MERGFALYDSPFGTFRLDYEDDTLIGLETGDPEATDVGQPTAFTDLVAGQLIEYFSGQRTAFDLPLSLRGTVFQKQVWQALSEIPYGETRTYKQIAEAIGNPLACRAVGLANNRNPISIIIPCHRVIGTNGKLVGYGGGIELKERLLKLEGALPE